MQIFNWKNFKGGWFVGDFTPTLFTTKDFEVCIKRYKAGDYENCHKHLVADEVTMIVQGQVRMSGGNYVTDDIILIEKGEATDFLAVTDTITCVIKIPSVKGDKYLV